MFDLQFVWFLFTGVVIGLLSMGLAFLCEILGTRLFQMSMTVVNVTGAPLLGLFCIGIFMPFVNSWVRYVRFNMRIDIYNLLTYNSITMIYIIFAC